ncbi:MAG: alpha/beta hydrolase family protein [Lentisphaeria bacterium]|jgi:S-formylglutathione hydrolase FrmB
MAWMDCKFFSETLGLSCSMYVLLPQPTRGQIGLAGAAGAGRQPVLFLLHGLSDDHTIWLRRTAIERYVAPLGLAVVMPAVDRSFYADMACGGRDYWSFVSEELPALCRGFFPLSARREDNFVAGLSMGGYGAFKLALRHPDRFAAAGSFSGALDMAATWERNDLQNPRELRNAFGTPEQFRGSHNDLFALAGRLAAAPGPKPQLYQCCGTEDFLHRDNLAFRDHARKLGLELAYEEEAGTHEWGYWDRKLRRFLHWLPLAKP